MLSKLFFSRIDSTLQLDFGGVRCGRDAKSQRGYEHRKIQQPAGCRDQSRLNRQWHEQRIYKIQLLLGSNSPQSSYRVDQSPRKSISKIVARKELKSQTQTN